MKLARHHQTATQQIPDLMPYLSFFMAAPDPCVSCDN